MSKKAVTDITIVLCLIGLLTGLGIYLVKNVGLDFGDSGDQAEITDGQDNTAGVVNEKPSNDNGEQKRVVEKKRRASTKPKSNRGLSDDPLKGLDL